MTDGRTHLAHKMEHGVDMDTGAIGAVTVQDASEGDTATRRHGDTATRRHGDTATRRRGDAAEDADDGDGAGGSGAAERSWG